MLMDDDEDEVSSRDVEEMWAKGQRRVWCIYLASMRM